MTESKDPIKILHLVDSMGVGGMENGLVNVAARLGADEFDIHVCCLSQRGVFADKMFNPQQVSAIGKLPGFSFKWVSIVREQINRVQPHLLHTHNLGPLIYGGLATRFGRTYPIVHGEHAQLNANEIQFKRLLQRKVFYRACTKIHTVSDSLLQDLKQSGLAAGGAVVTRNGVDGGRFFSVDNKKEARKKLDIPLKEGGRLLGIVGRISEFKGHLLLLDAFDQLCNRGLNLRLVIVGGGGVNETLVIDRVRKSPFRNQIYLTGVQKNPEKYMQAMELMVFPSSNEGLSNAVLESMACGVPVLASDACGNNEAIVNGENGFQASIGTLAGLSDAMECILTDRESLEVIGKKARKHMIMNFSIDSMVEGYKKLYREACGHC